MEKKSPSIAVRVIAACGVILAIALAASAMDAMPEEQQVNHYTGIKEAADQVVRYCNEYPERCE